MPHQGHYQLFVEDTANNTNNNDVNVDLLQSFSNIWEFH
jgi:hypothetical protein